MRIYQKDRKNPVRLFDDPAELTGLKCGADFTFDVMREEYFVVQLLLCECSGDYAVSVSGMEGRATVYNTQGIDKFGRPFTRKDDGALSSRSCGSFRRQTPSSKKLSTWRS